MSRTEERGSRILLELMLVMGASVLLFMFAPSLVWVGEILSLGYLFIERRIRHRPFESLGLKFHGLLHDLRANLAIILLVAIGIQLGVVFGSYWLWPPLFDRIGERASYLQTHFASFAPSMLFLTFIGIATLVEELIFRGLVQERISWFSSSFAGIAIGSLLMTIFHYSPGQPLAVAADLFFVFLDSSLYGLIYMRSRSIPVAWLAHLTADLVALSFLWIL